MEGPHHLAGRVGVALRVLGRLISAANAEEELRPVIGFPAVWCGVDLLRNMSGIRPDSLPPIAALEEFSSMLAAVTSDGKLAPHCSERGCPRCEAYHAWNRCLLSARAELAVLGTAAAEYRRLPKLVVIAFEAAAQRLVICVKHHSQAQQLLQLYITARLLSLTTTIANRAALPGSELKRMLWPMDEEAVMCLHNRVVQRLWGLVFSSEGSDEEDSGEGGESSTPVFNADTKVAMLDWLRGVLTSLLVFLDAGMQLDAFMHYGGVELLLQCFDMYTDKAGQLGQLEHKFEEVLLVAAQCTVALLASSGREEARQEFMAAAGFRRLLDTMNALPLRLLAETFLSTGRYTLWQLQCTAMKVLEVATLEWSHGRAEFIWDGGIESLVRAARWVPDKPGISRVPDHYKHLPQDQKVGLEDLFASVAAHAFAVVGQVCISGGKPGYGGEHQGQPFLVLAGVSSLEEMEQWLKLGDVTWDQPGGRPWAPVLAKIAPISSLRTSVVLCTTGLLRQRLEAREDFMQLKYKELFSAHLAFAQHDHSGGIQMLAKSLVFRAFAKIMGERAAWRRDILQRRVHLLAGDTLAEAVDTLKHDALAGRKARLHKLQARSRGRAGAGACGCGQSGCTLEDMAGFAKGLAEDIRATRVIEATSLLLSSLGFLTALREASGEEILKAVEASVRVTRQAGKEGRQAALEVLGCGRLAEAAKSSPSLASISADLKESEASLNEWLTWGEQLVQQSGGKPPTQLDAEKAAEAAAAALLAEEEAVQHKAAAKAAKRQRQKAAKQRAGAAQQPEEPSGALLHGTEVEPRDAGDADAPSAAGDSSSSATLRHGPVAMLTPAAPTQRPTEAQRTASSSASQEVDLTSAAQPLEAEDSGARQAGSRGGSRREALVPSQSAAHASSSQEAPASRTAGRAGKLKKPQIAEERQQTGSPLQNGALYQSAAGLLRAAPAGKERAPPAIIPALAAILGSAAPTHPASNTTAAAVTAPATPPRPASPALPPPSSADAPLLAPAPLLGAAPLPPAKSGAAPAAAVAVRSEEPVASEALDTVEAAQAAEAQVAEYQVLLEYLLPGISLDDHKAQARPTSHQPAAMASDGRSLAGSQASDNGPPEASSNQQQQQGQQQAFHPGEGLATVCITGGSSKLPPALEAVLVCRLSGQPLSDPVIAADGFTYEREALTAWVQLGKLQSPVTGRPLSSGAVRPNLAVRDLLSALLVC
ncbi:hypothetical protein N2152v2_009287 [Parachlorella kessleri]